jgi:hypothetical protein
VGAELVVDRRPRGAISISAVGGRPAIDPKLSDATRVTVPLGAT